jgi:hypothetical protein
MAAEAGGLPPQALAAIWGVVQVAVVAVATWLFRAYQAARDDRRARLRSLVALRAEIEAKRLAQKNNFDANSVDDLCRRMDEEPGYVPHVPIEAYRAYVFGLLGDRLMHLPRYAVRHVVAFYEWDSVVHHAFAHLASAEFAALAADRRITTWRAIPAMTDEHRRRGRRAIAALRRYERLDHATLRGCRRRIPRWVTFWWPLGRGLA